MGKFIDLTGQRFGELVVLSLAPLKLKNRPAWLCRCDCSIERVVRAEDLRSGMAKSCGKHKTAVAREIASQSAKRLRLYQDHGTRSRLYTIWRAMKWRCHDPAHSAWARYGGAGVKVCAEWLVFQRFRSWALSSGYEESLSLDRIDSAGDYEPGNCRWATSIEQARNKRSGVRPITAFGETKLAVEWAQDPRCRTTYSTLVQRIAAGHPPERAMTASEFELRSLAHKGRPKPRKSQT